MTVATAALAAAVMGSRAVTARVAVVMLVVIAFAVAVAVVMA